MDDAVGRDCAEELADAEHAREDDVGDAVPCRVGDEERDRGDDCEQASERASGVRSLCGAGSFSRGASRAAERDGAALGMGSLKRQRMSNTSSQKPRKVAIRSERRLAR